MEHLKITSVRHLKVKGVMNMSEKVGRLGLGLFHHTAEKIFRKVMFCLIVFS